MNLLLTVAILFTLPSAGQHVFVDPSQDADSVMVECSGGQAIHQLSTARLYYYPLTGGGWRLAQEHTAQGREGRPDSFIVDSGPGGHYYVTATNPRGESCASPLVYVPGSITGVGNPDGPTASPVSIETFDVQGRLCRSLVRSGVYFRRTIYSNGRVSTKKIVFVR